LYLLFDFMSRAGYREGGKNSLNKPPIEGPWGKWVQRERKGELSYFTRGGKKGEKNSYILLSREGGQSKGEKGGKELFYSSYRGGKGGERGGGADVVFWPF